MIWAVVTNGVDQSFSFAKKTIPANTDFTIRFIWSYSAEKRGFQIGEVSSFNNGVSLFHTKQAAWNAPSIFKSYVAFSGVSSALNHIEPLALNTVYDWELQRVNGVIDLVDTATQVSLLTSTATNANAFSFDEFAKWGGNSNYFHGETQLIQITSAGNNYKWDAAASSHAAGTVVLTETIGGNDATGDFITDGSAWVNSGGGTDQAITVITAEQLTESQLVTVSSLNNINAVIAEQSTQVQLSDVILDNQVSIVVTEQITQSSTTGVNESQLIYAVQSQQLTDAMAVVVTTKGPQDINAVIAEQITHAINGDIQQLLAINAAIAEQLTQTELLAIIQSNIANELNIDIDQITLEILTPRYSIESLTPIYTIEHIH